MVIRGLSMVREPLRWFLNVTLQLSGPNVCINGCVYIYVCTSLYIFAYTERDEEVGNESGSSGS